MSTPRERLAGAKAELMNLRRNRDQEIADARASVRQVVIDGETTDAETQTMTAKGIQRRREELAEKVRASYADRIKQLEASVRQDAERLQREANDARPKLGADAVSLQRAEMAWQGVRQRLEAGMSPSQILATANRDTALAIAEWGPAWLEARSFEARGSGLIEAMTWEAPDGEALGRAVDARLAELDDGFREAHAAAVEAQGVAAYVTPIMQNEAAPHPLGGLGAALEAHYAQQNVAADHGVTAADGAADAGGDAA